MAAAMPSGSVAWSVRTPAPSPAPRSSACSPHRTWPRPAPPPEPRSCARSGSAHDEALDVVPLLDGLQLVDELDVQVALHLGIQPREVLTGHLQLVRDGLGGIG